MKKILAVTLIAAVWLPVLTADARTKPPAKGPDPKKTPPKSVQAEVQTARWAVKWWKARHIEKIALKKKMGKVDLLMIGDSITHVWDDRRKAGATWDKYYAKRNTLNIGFSGDRTENVLWRLRNGAVDDISPKLAVLMIGTNNAGHRREASAETALGIKAILAELAKRLPKTKVLLLAIFPRGKDDNDALRKLNMGTNKIANQLLAGPPPRKGWEQYYKMV